MSDLRAFVDDLSPSGLINAGDQIEHRGLSRSVGTHHSQDLSFRHIERETVNRCQVSKSLCQVLNRQDIRHFGLISIKALRPKGRSFPAWCFLYVVPLDPALRGGIARYSPVKQGGVENFNII